MPYNTKEKKKAWYNRIKIFAKKCIECNKEYFCTKYKERKSKFCSYKCRQIGSWKLGIKKRGDVQRGRGKGRTYTKLNGRHEHRVVMEQIIGRKLKKDEIVHHINKNKKDNRKENLQIMSRSEHSRMHSTKYN